MTQISYINFEVEVSRLPYYDEKKDARYHGISADC